ncbi:ParB/RepB/Spo0J family partition protein [Mycoplasmatota bacterium WC44]
MKSRLGKGLGELFNENYFLDGVMEGESSTNIDLNDVVPNPYQPRKIFDDKQLQELADSIKEHGVITPIIVKLVENQYVLIAGERRTRASRLAGLTTVPAIIRDYSDSQMMEIALLENIQREDLTPIEVAHSYKNIIENLNITQDQLSKRVGKSRSHITNMVGLLSLPSEIQSMVDQGDLSMGHARVLSKFEDQERALEIAKRARDNKLSVRDIEALGREEVKKVKVVRKNINVYESYQQHLIDILGMDVSIKKGNVTIKFKEMKDLEELIAKVK